MDMVKAVSALLMRKRSRMLLLFILLCVGSTLGSVSNAAQPHVDVLNVDGVVNPVLSNYLDRGIDRAEEDGAEACIINMDTPGGLLSSTEDIVERIDEAEVPIVVYVNPWAGSAGTFITLAADVAAISPGARIGAASPVSGGGEEISETMKKKVTQDTSAWIEAIANEHGRNSAAAIAAVAEAASYSYEEALGLDEVEDWEALGLDSSYIDPPLVDVGADSLEALVEMLGQGVVLVDGTQFNISPGSEIKYVDMSTPEDFLYTISDPNIAYILMSLAMLGLLIELANPGLIFPGVVGGLSLILSIYSLGVLDANWAGVILILLAVGLFVAELFTTTFGLLTAGGVAAMALGSLILFSGTPFEIDWWLIVIVVSLFTSIFVIVVWAVVRTMKMPVNTGVEGLVGQTGVVVSTLDPKGVISLQGENWNAVVDGEMVEAGEEVMVTKVNGLKLTVVRKEKEVI
ncbi:MAG: nodulation protein NfeD [Chloroflexota bacterium]|nr:nodulation protein NfeD [Chloroflexota bacterium]